MIGLIVLGAIVVFVVVVWLNDRRRPAGPMTRWDDPGQAEAHAAASLSKLGHSQGGRT